MVPFAKAVNINVSNRPSLATILLIEGEPILPVNCGIMLTINIYNCANLHDDNFALSCETDIRQTLKAQLSTHKFEISTKLTMQCSAFRDFKCLD